MAGYLSPREMAFRCNGTLVIVFLTGFIMSVPIGLYNSAPRSNFIWKKYISQPLNSTQSTGRVTVYYHLYATNNWQMVAADQMNKLIYSGLFDEADSIQCCVSGPSSDDANRFLGLFGSQINITLHDPADTSYERATLMFMRNVTLPSDRILYFHSKGVSDGKQERDMALKVYLWRSMMVCSLQLLQ